MTNGILAFGRSAWVPYPRDAHTENDQLCLENFSRIPQGQKINHLNMNFWEKVPTTPNVLKGEFS